MLGYICKYAPIEVFRSMGVEMKRIEPRPFLYLLVHEAQQLQELLRADEQMHAHHHVEMADQLSRGLSWVLRLSSWPLSPCARSMR